MVQWATWTTDAKRTIPSMQAMPTDIGMAKPQAFSAATLLILGSGLALYQMTSLMLGPAGSRQLDLSLSLPTLETHELGESPASGAVIGNLVIPVPLASSSTTVPAHRATSRTAAPPKTTSVAPVPVVPPPSVVTVPPVAPQDAHPERHPLPVVAAPQPERDDEPD